MNKSDNCEPYIFLNEELTEFTQNKQTNAYDKKQFLFHDLKQCEFNSIQLSTPIVIQLKNNSPMDLVYSFYTNKSRQNPYLHHAYTFKTFFMELPSYTEQYFTTSDLVNHHFNSLTLSSHHDVNKKNKSHTKRSIVTNIKKNKRLHTTMESQNIVNDMEQNKKQSFFQHLMKHKSTVCKYSFFKDFVLALKNKYQSENLTCNYVTSMVNEEGTVVPLEKLRYMPYVGVDGVVRLVDTEFYAPEQLDSEALLVYNIYYSPLTCPNLNLLNVECWSKKLLKHYFTRKFKCKTQKLDPELVEMKPVYFKDTSKISEHESNEKSPIRRKKLKFKFTFKNLLKQTYVVTLDVRTLTYNKTYCNFILQYCKTINQLQM